MIFKPSSPAAYRLLMEGSSAFADIEEAGIRVDMRHVDRTMSVAGDKIKQIEASLRRDEVYKIWRRVYGEKASLGSGEQLARVIFDNLGVECKERTATGKPKTDAEALEGIDLPFVRKWSLLEKLKKVRNTFLRGTQRLAVQRGDDWFIHPSFNLHLVWTYRSCVAKGTLVEVVRDVRKFPKGIPIEDVRAGDLAYCYDDDLNLTVKRVKWAGKTGRRRVVRLHWTARGKHGHLDVTPEHLVRLSSGEYEEASNLSGDFRTATDSKHSPKTRVLAMGRVMSRVYQTGVSRDILDHHLVYRAVIGDIPAGMVIHHRDGNHLNNAPENLELMSRSDHSRYHVLRGDCLTAEDIKRGAAASVAKRRLSGGWPTCGPENAHWIHFSKFGFLRLLSAAGGKITRAGHDFECLRSKAAHLGVDVRAVRDRYDKDGRYISRGRLLSVFDGSVHSVSKPFGINRDKAQRLLVSRGLRGGLKRPARHFYGRAGKPHNHKIVKIEYLEDAVDVYDIEVEDHHNFIANELCVHNSSSEPNFQNQPVRDKRQAKLIRRAYIPRDGHVLVETDFSAMEFKGAACVIGSTLIETIDGSQSIVGVIDRLGRGEEVWVYGWNHEKSRVAVHRVLEGGLTRKKAPVWRAVLDNGESVVATGDHKFMLRDGTYRNLVDLKSGDSLMPFYTRNVRSSWGTVYQQIMLNNGKRVWAHQLIAEDVLGVRIAGSGLVVHHDDGNGLNNSLSNLEPMTRQLHMSIHASQGWKNNGEGRRRNNRLRAQSPEMRESMRIRNRNRKKEWSAARWEQWRQNGRAAANRPEVKAKKLLAHLGKKRSATARKNMSDAKKRIGCMPIVSGWNRGLTKETHPSIRAAADKNKGRAPPNKGIRKDPVRHICEWCGDEFCTRWKLTKPRRFCSHRCAAFQREHLKTAVNHKVVAVEFVGHEDVYNITVDEIHNYATTAGVMIKNCFWKDPAMVAYASDPKLDIHRDMAGECFLLPVDNVSKDCRAFAKNQFVFPELYGSYYVSMAAGLWTSISRAGLKTKDGVGIYEHLRTKGIRTAKEFESHIKRVEQKFNERFAHWSAAKDRWWQKYLERGWFPLATGFVCPGIFSYNNLMNTPIQGPSFHCLLWSVIQVNAWLKKNKMRSKIVGQIHDSILADVRESELQDYLNYVREVMTVKVRQHWDWIVTPLDVEVDVSDRSWFDKSSWKEENGLWVSA